MTIVYAKRIIILLFAALLGGCFTGPRNNSGFDWVEKLAEFNGVYKNRGDSGKTREKPIYLSQLIWPEPGIDHASILSVRVRAVDEQTLIVTAMKEQEVIRESTFIQGKDFELNLGNITLMRQFMFSPFTSGSNPIFIGLAYGMTKIGLDRQGDAKFRENTAVAGVGYLIIPIVGGVQEDVRFLRLEER